jgi:centromere/kinetochore protein ZW10
MRQGYHDSVKIAGASEKCSLKSSSSSGKKGKGGSGSSATSISSSADEVESSCFQVPDYRVTVCAHEVVELVHQTLVEACTSGASSASLLFQTARDLFFLFRTIVPTLYEDDIANDPRTCMLYHNDCLYITYHMLVMGHLYKHRCVL